MTGISNEVNSSWMHVSHSLKRKRLLSFSGVLDFDNRTTPPSPGRHPWLLPLFHPLQHQDLPPGPSRGPSSLFTALPTITLILLFLHGITTKSPVWFSRLEFWLSTNPSFTCCQRSLSNGEPITSLTQILLITFKIQISLLWFFLI